MGFVTGVVVGEKVVIHIVTWLGLGFWLGRDASWEETSKRVELVSAALGWLATHAAPEGIHVDVALLGRRLRLWFREWVKTYLRLRLYLWLCFGGSGLTDFLRFFSSDEGSGLLLCPVPLLQLLLKLHQFLNRYVSVNVDHLPIHPFHFLLFLNFFHLPPLSFRVQGNCITVAPVR